MAFYQASTKKEDLETGGSAYINGSGMYPVNLLAAFVSVSSGGSESIDLFVEHEGQKQVVYGNLRITNNDKTPNKIGSKIFNQLVICSGLEEVAEPVAGELPIGTKGAMKEVDILEDFCDIELMMRVQMEYSIYKGNIQEKKVIKAFFRGADNASAEEIVNESQPGVGYEKDMKYASNVTYKDGLTEEHITKWISEKRPKGTAPSGTQGAEAPSFGKKRFGE